MTEKSWQLSLGYFQFESQNSARVQWRRITTRWLYEIRKSSDIIVSIFDLSTFSLLSNQILKLTCSLLRAFLAPDNSIHALLIHIFMLTLALTSVLIALHYSASLRRVASSTNEKSQLRRSTLSSRNIHYIRISLSTLFMLFAFVCNVYGHMIETRRKVVQMSSNAENGYITFSNAS